METPLVTLVVDDDATTRFLVCRLLQREQVPGQVVEAGDGQQALTLLQNWCAATSPTPILVLVDLNMPVMDGVEFLHQQQALPSAYRQLMTTVVVSSSAAASDKQRVQALANAYVTKPLTSAVLHQVIQQHLTRCGLTS